MRYLLLICSDKNQAPPTPAQMEAMEGRGEVISGGLLSPEREELSTRMRFKRTRFSGPCTRYSA